jgi:biotin--protein ligase
MTSKLFFEELRCYVRSEKHLNYIQSWTESFSPCIPLYLWQKDANTHKKDDSIVNPSFQERLFPKLDTNILGNIVLYKHAMASTQTLLYEELKPSAPEFTICYTDVQIKGKGRGSNIWTSPDGCLMFSFKSSFTDGNSLPFVQYLISLAIVKAFETIQATKIPSKATAIGTKGSVRIKWPNDLYVDKLKIGGILCQSEFHDGKFDVTTGIGINIFNQEPTTCIMDVLQKEDPTCHLTKYSLLKITLLSIQDNFISNMCIC